MSPWFGKKKQEEVPVSTLNLYEYGEFRAPGPTSGLVFFKLKGKDAICASAINSRKIKAMTPDGDEIWAYTAAHSIFSLARASFEGKDTIIAGGGGKVIAISAEGEKLWEYTMPAGSGIMAALSSGTSGLQRIMQDVIGFEDVYHLATGKLNGDDVVVALAAGIYMTEGPQVIRSDGTQKCALKTKTLGMTRPIQIAGCMLDLSPKGDALLGMVVYKAYGKVSVITQEAKMVRDIKFHIDEARKPGGPLPLPDKRRGRLIGGKFGERDVFVVGTPIHASVAAVSLDGTQLWNYFTTRAIGPMTGVNDVKIGSVGGKPAVLVGCLDNSAHIVDEGGHRMYYWEPGISPVTNVDWGKIDGEDAIVVGLYDGQIKAYTISE